MTAERRRKLAANALIWLVLLTMPLWLNAIGGYTQLGTLVIVMALAAMALNFLLGFTGPCRSATRPISASAPTGRA